MSAFTPTPYTRDVYWSSTNVGEAGRRQSTTPQNALTGLPNQRPVQTFNSPGLYGIPPDDWASLNASSKAKSAPTYQEARAVAGTKGTVGTRPATMAEDSPAQKATDFCARWLTADCNAFNNKEFKRLCGLCLEARGPGEVAGLHYDRTAIMEDANPKPTVGTCSPRAFVIDKATCERRQKELYCEREGSFSDSECAVCTTDATMRYVPTSSSGSGSSSSQPATLRLFGRGRVIVSVGGASGSARGSDANPLYDGPLEGRPIPLTGLREGTMLYIRVGGESVGGLLVGTTRSGPYVVDISKLIEVDTLTSAAPRREGYIGVGGDQYVFRMLAGAGRGGLVLPLRIPFEFVETAACSTGPVVRTDASAKQLHLGECAGPRAVPGNYSLGCLKRIWEVNGCTAAGRGFPDDIKKAPEILWDAESRPRGLADIHAYVRELALMARTGLGADGRPAAQRDTERARVQCLGKSLLEPCGMREADGSLQVECMAALYTGAGGLPRGTLRPAAAEAIKWARSNGGATGDVDMLRRAYERVKRLADDDATPQQERLAAIRGVYGYTHQELREADLLRSKVMGRPAVTAKARTDSSRSSGRSSSAGLPGF